MNRLKQKLLARELTFMMAIRSASVLDPVVVAQVTGHDAVYIDLQHGSMPSDMLPVCCRLIGASGMTPLVRVAADEPSLIGHALDGGAEGVIIPDVESAASARRCVAAALFPPRGERSFAGIGVQVGIGGTLRPPMAAMRHLDGRVMVMPMVETPPGIVAAEDILAVDGVDAVLVGVGDLTAALGEGASAQVEAACASVIEAGCRVGKPVVMAGVRDPETLARYIAMGAARCLITGNDLAFMLAGAESRIQAARTTLAG